MVAEWNNFEKNLLNRKRRGENTFTPFLLVSLPVIMNETLGNNTVFSDIGRKNGISFSTNRIYDRGQGTKVDVMFDRDTVWLTTAQMTYIFQRVRSVILEYIKNSKFSCFSKPAPCKRIESGKPDRWSRCGTF